MIKSSNHMFLTNRTGILIFKPFHNTLLMVQMFTSKCNCSLACRKFSTTNRTAIYILYIYLWSLVIFFCLLNFSNYYFDIPLLTLPIDYPNSINCYKIYVKIYLVRHIIGIGSLLHIHYCYIMGKHKLLHIFIHEATYMNEILRRITMID